MCRLKYGFLGGDAFFMVSWRDEVTSWLPWCGFTPNPVVLSKGYPTVIHFG